MRQYPLHEVLAYLFAISDSTVSRYIARMLPLLEASGRDTMRMPDPGKKRRRNLDALLADTPELAVVIDTFEQRVQRPRERAAANCLYSGKKKQHTLKSQVAVDEESGWIVDIADSVPGPRGDIKVLEDSGLLNRLPAGVGGIGDWPTWGSTNCTRRAWARRHAANRAAKTARPKISSTIGRFRGDGSWSNTALDGCGAINR